jgi:hypothetical protein
MDTAADASLGRRDQSGASTRPESNSGPDARAVHQEKHSLQQIRIPYPVCPNVLPGMLGAGGMNLTSDARRVAQRDGSAGSGSADRGNPSPRPPLAPKRNGGTRGEGAARIGTKGGKESHHAARRRSPACRHSPPDPLWLMHHAALHLYVFLARVISRIS